MGRPVTLENSTWPQDREKPATSESMTLRAVKAGDIRKHDPQSRKKPGYPKTGPVDDAVKNRPHPKTRPGGTGTGWKICTAKHIRGKPGRTDYRGGVKWKVL